nr:MAG: hypothetical protein [uncultured archaeon]
MKHLIGKTVDIYVEHLDASGHIYLSETLPTAKILNISDTNIIVHSMGKVISLPFSTVKIEIKGIEYEVSK